MGVLNFLTGTAGYTAILIALALLSGCASGHEQAEADAAERRAKGVGQ